ncbi:hypothetical protein MAH1_19260 [Sessilibacter sp. MAH1]
MQFLPMLELLENPPQNWPLRFVIIHLHPTSARLRFLINQTGHLSLPSKLPSLSEIIENDNSLLSQKILSNSNVVTHPSSYLKKLCTKHALPLEQLDIVSEFKTTIDTPGCLMNVFLLRVSSEQPFQAPMSWRWIELPDSFQLISIERLIMKKIYEFYLD